MFTTTGNEPCITRSRVFNPDNEREITLAPWQRMASSLAEECRSCPAFSQCWEELNGYWENSLLPPAGVMAGIIIGISGKPHGKFVQENLVSYRAGRKARPDVTPSTHFERILQVPDIVELREHLASKKTKKREHVQ